MNSNRLNEKKLFIGIITLLSILLIAGGYFYYSESSKSIKSNKENELTAIARVKLNQISAWYIDELYDAQVISEDKILVDFIAKNLRDENDLTKENLTGFLKSLRNQHDVEDIIVTDLNLNIISATNPVYNLSKLPQTLINNIQEALEKKITLSTDLYICEINNSITIDFISPIYNSENNIIAAIIFRFDPELFLFPLIQSWPLISESAETFLIRKEGDSVLYLNELRHKQNTALNLRIPLTEKNNSAVAAIDGVRGIFRGIDYRGVNVLSYISEVPGTNWYIIADVDEDEILSELKYYWVYVFLFVLILILLLSSLISWVYFYRQREIYKKLWESQEEYRTTLQSIGDAVITTNIKGEIVYVNPVAEKLTGWSLKNAKKKNLKKVFKIINEENRTEIENPVEKVLAEGVVIGLANHTLLISKEGREIPITDSGAPIRDKSGSIIGVVLVFRDQTEERKFQKEILRLNRVYALLSNTNEAIVRIKDEQKLFDEICSIAINEGKFQIAWIGMLSDNSNEFVVAASEQSQIKDFNKGNYENYKIKPCRCLSDEVLDKGEYLIVNDLQNSTHIKICVNDELLAACNSAASFPIKKFNKVVGTLNLFSDEIGFFNKEEIKLLVEMVYDISFALEYFETEKNKNSSIEKIKESERLLRIAGDTAKLGGWSVDLENNVIIWSDEVAEIHECPVGFSPTIQEGINFYAPEWREKIQEVFTKCISKDIPFDEEMEIITAKGNRVWIRTIGQAVKNDEGKMTGVEGAFQDITYKKKHEKALLESEEKYRLLVENSHDGIEITQDDRIIYSNKQFASMLGYTVDEIINISFKELYTEKGLKELFEREKKRNSGEELIKEYETTFRKKNGNIIYVAVKFEIIEFNNKPATFATVQDITERKKAEETLRESEEFIRTVMENLPVGIAVNTVEPDVKFRYINNNFIRFYRTTKEALKNPDSFWEAVYPDPVFREKIRKKVLDDCASGDIKRMFWWDIPIIREGEETTFISARNIPLPEKDVMISVVWDVTERVKAQKKLKESEEKFRDIFYHHAAIKMIIDPETQNIVEANKAAAQYYGWSIDELQNMKISQINTLSPEEINIAIEKAKSLNKIHFEFKHRKADGSINDVEVFSSTVVIAGKTYLHSIVHDISEKKKAEEQLELLSRSVEQSPVSVLITDPQGCIEYVNPCFERVTGYTLDEIKGKNPKILNSGHQSGDVYQNLWQTILSGKEWKGELMNKKKNGENYWEDIIISPIVNSEGDILHFVAVKEDITEKKKIIEELIEAKEKAEEMNRLKSSFLANMSHELRTPIIGITGFSYILQEELKDPALKEMAKGISESGNRLSETLNLILDLSKLEAEKTNFKIDEFDLVFETEDLLKPYRNAAHKKGLKFSSSYSEEILKFSTDIRAYRSVISNLVNNAIKYTVEGEVNVAVSLYDSKAVIKVSDTGIGIAKENHNLIFEEFRQVSEGLSRNFEGTGLGLNITKKLVEIFGGEIKVESELGKGSTFIVTLPQGKTEMKSLVQKEISIEQPFIITEVKAKKPLALLVDDDPIVFDVLRRFTSELIILEYCKSADTSIEMLKEKQYDLIFMDINLRKGMDGKQATRAIREIAGYKNTPIIAFTAYAMVGDKEEFLDAGCTHYLSKPFTKVDVIELVEEIIEKR